MNLNWFPGHMAKATREIREALPKVDVIIEVLDARIPYSSENPVIGTIRGKKPCIKLLTKSDLADPLVTQQWLDEFEPSDLTSALATTTKQPEKIREVIKLVRRYFPAKAHGPKGVTAMIMGVPNSGKSTTINILADRIIAKTGNEPAVTKAQQRIKLEQNVILYDTPGILWPKVENPDSGYRLAVTGAIRDAVTESDDIAFYLIEYLLSTYPHLLRERFNLESLPETPLEFIDAIGASRGSLRSGGRVDLAKISRILINEFRTGVIGRISLETPAMAKKERIETERRVAEKKAQLEAAKKKKKGSRQEKPEKRA